MRAASATPQAGTPQRVDWVDYAKGLCILLVVMFHTVNHYEAAIGSEGWLRWLVDFSKPFRMPDFFLISGLFLSRTISAPLRDYIDRKVLHFAYFYFLWLAITLVVTDNDVLRADPVGWLKLFGWHVLQPVGTLWFVHMLAVFYVLTRMLRGLPKWGVLTVAAALQIAHQGGWIDTPSFAANRLMDYYVFFFLGFAASGLVFDLAGKVRERRLHSIGVLTIWAVGNWWLTRHGLHLQPVNGLLMGLAGALAIIELSALLSLAKPAAFLRYCGRNSIVIYLTFFFPMLALERLLAKHQVIPDVGAACAVILVASVILPLAFHRLIRGTPVMALYVRPRWARTGLRDPKPAPAIA